MVPCQVVAHLWSRNRRLIILLAAEWFRPSGGPIWTHRSMGRPGRIVGLVTVDGSLSAPEAGAFPARS